MILQAAEIETMADYDIERTLWTNPCANWGMWNAAQRCWETSAAQQSAANAHRSFYQSQLERVRGEIDTV